MNDLEQKTAKWHKLATKLLKESKLEEILAKYGDVLVTGSYNYKLILSPDIDMYLVVDKPSRELAIKVLNDLIEQDWWQNYEFGDFLAKKFRIPKWDFLPEGIYLQVKQDFEGERWNIDIWIVDAQECKKRNWNNILTNITADQRQAILKLKDARVRKEINCSSHFIYESVLNKGAREVKDLEL